MKTQESAPMQSATIAELDSRFRAGLMAYFVRRTGNRSDAEDLTQDTFLRLINSDTFDQAHEANAYVFRVASNLLRDRERANARWKAYRGKPLSELPSDEIALDNVEGLQPERVLIGKESLSEALKCLNELGEQTKNIFILFRLEGMKQKEIAELYGLGTSTIEKRVMLAMSHLVRRLGSYS
jgi:RNA polymerase sigma factor (sigma-70 family)